MMIVPPRNILAGIGALGREEMARFLAFFNNANMLTLLTDQTLDWCVRGKRYLDTKMGNGGKTVEVEQEIKRFEQRVEVDFRRIVRSKSTNADLRLQLWNTLRVCLDLPVSIPLSTVVADRKAAELAVASAEHYSNHSGIRDQIKKIFAKFRKDQENPDMQFGDIVRQEAVRMMASAVEKGILSEEEQRRVTDEFARSLEDLPSDMKDEAIEKAIQSGDRAIISLLASTGSTAGLAVAVDIAGFSAYILAAKIASIIPLLGAKTAVSLLAVLSNPWLIPVVAGGTMAYQGKKIHNKARENIATTLTIQLAILGFQDHETNFHVFMDEVRIAASKADIHAISEGALAKKQQRKESHKALVRTNKVRKEYPEGLPALPDSSGILALASEDEDESTRDLFQKLLFSESRQQRKEDTIIAASAAGASLLDAVYNALVVDPKVIAAADFSRTESIKDVFEFSGFASRIRAMDEAAREGGETALRGYTAEMYVASRLSGHQVSLPDSSNYPGVDLIVDGEPFQVKCYESADSGLQALKNHFEKNPDIPVFVNSEVATAASSSSEEWAGKVIPVEGFDFSTVDGMVEQSLSSAARLQQEYAPMLYVLMINSAYHLYRWRKGLVSLKDLPFEIALTGAARGGLSLAGGITGSAIGGLLFGPAGVVILTPLIATGALFQTGRVMKGVDHVLGVQKEWEETIDKAAGPFRRVLQRTIKEKISLIDQKISELDGANHEVAIWVRRKLEDERLALTELGTELAGSGDLKPIQSAQTMLRIMTEASVLPISVQPELDAFIHALNAKPSRRAKSKEKWNTIKGKISEKMPIR